MMAAAVILLGMSACKKAENQALQQEEIPQPANAAEMDQVVASLLDKLAPEDSVATRTSEIVTTPSGLKYRVVKEGTGKQPTAQDVVSVNYEGRLLDGTVFDSSYDRGEPAQFPLSGVIPGWTEGLQYMKEGAVYEFYIPYNLAYGDRDNPAIPAKSDLLFKVQLLEVKAPEN